jgi:anti-sigma factor ChrR (cupin superfamily)
VISGIYFREDLSLVNQDNNEEEAMEEIKVNTNEMEWRESAEYPQGVWEKVLHDGSDKAPKSCLLKIEPGWGMDAHAHVYTEMHYVLEGEYESQGQVFREGVFRMIPKHVNHGPFTTETGATILVIWVELHQ